MSEGTDQIPASRFAGTATDDSGNDLLATGDETAGAFGDDLVSFIQRGLENADFVHAPMAPDSEITLENQLPRWPLTIVSGTAVHPYSVEDASAASGRVLRFAMAEGVAGDESYVEQIVRVNGSRGQSYAYVQKVTVLTPSVSNAIAFRVVGQYLKRDRVTTTGSADTTDTLFSAITGPKDIAVNPPDGIFVNPLPSDAYYIRLRIGIRRAGAATTDTGYIDVCEVRNLNLSDHAGAVDQTTPSNEPATLLKTGGVTTLRHTAVSTITFSDPSAVIHLMRLDTGGTARIDLYGGTTDNVTLAGQLILEPDTQSITGVGNTLEQEGPILMFTSNGVYTLTSTPTIVSGTDGQFLKVINVGANAVTIQDQGTLASSNLRLSTATFAIGPRDSITLVYSSTIGDWVEVGRSNVI